jgi:alanine racemase
MIVRSTRPPRAALPLRQTSRTGRGRRRARGNDPPGFPKTRPSRLDTLYPHGGAAIRVGDHPLISNQGVVRPTQLEVDLDRIAANYRLITAHVGRPVMAVLKANAYGHGLVEVAARLEREGAPYLGVAYLEEALLLRERGVGTPILVLGGIMENQIPLFLRHRITLTASSLEKLRQIDEAAAALGTRARVHLKIDTGMERIGVHHYHAEPFLEQSLRCRHTDVEGVFSHLASADATNLDFARLQLERFQSVLRFYDARGLRPPRRHIANSGAILQLPESWLDMVRPGILLYGVHPSRNVGRTLPVQPALRWTSRVVYFKVVRAGDPVSYNSTWRSDHPVRVVTVPVGYGDGYPRRLSNRGEVLIRGRRYPVIGQVCMDQVMVDIEQDSAFNGDEVVLLGAQEGEAITAEDLAEQAETIPYEILTAINTRVPRLYGPERE